MAERSDRVARVVEATDGYFASTSTDVIDREKALIRAWRGQGDKRSFLGLALSGGGIRSAIFSLGVMQALAARGLLEKFDYLSTLSGGGYIGASIDWFLKQSRDGVELPDGEKATCGLGPGDFPFGTGDPREDFKADKDTAPWRRLRYLRQHGNYLTPGGGITMLSGIAIVVRAMMLNLFVWLSVLVVTMGIGVGLSPLLPAFDPPGRGQFFVVLISLCSLLAVLFVFSCLAYSLFTHRRRGLTHGHYRFRRRFEKHAHVGLLAMIIVGTLASLPYVEGLIRSYGETVSLGSLLAGLSIGVWAYFKAGHVSVSKIPVSLVVLLSAILLIYGLLLTSFIWANAIHRSAYLDGIAGAYWAVLAGLGGFSGILG